MRALAYRHLQRRPRLRALSSLARGRQAIALDYAIHPKVRYGFGRPPHHKLESIINQQRETFHRELKGVLAQSNALSKLPIDWWSNEYLPVLDAATIYYFIASRRPENYLEIGSGISTMFARQSIQDSKLSTKIISIDPTPRENINKLCDTIIREPVENIDLAIFASLQAGDIILVDNSHQSFQNSDVTVFFLDILPNLKPGVLVGIHDITLPDDYPPAYANNFYNEQYLLAAFLLGGGQGIDITLANWYVSQDKHLSQILAPLLTQTQFQETETHGCLFWLTIT